VTHLIELLRHADPIAFGFDKVIVWGSRETLAQLEARPWLDKRWSAVMERNFVLRAFWQRFSLGRLTQLEAPALLFVPGGSFSTGYRPVVTMSRNMLPFEPLEVRRYGWVPFRIKLELLRWTQTRSLRQASGRIFLTEYARSRIETAVGPFQGQTATIPHGVDQRFIMTPRVPRPVSDCSEADPFRFVYVSTIDVYKYQSVVAEAIATLRAEGLPVALDLVGGVYPPALSDLRSTLQRVDRDARFIRYLGQVPYKALHECYERADAAIFASGCENMPNTLLEKMAAGLPTVCARRGPMPSMLGDAGLYFDPSSASDLADALRRLIADDGLRARLAALGHVRAAQYSWSRCAEETFAFLGRVAATP
jgi:glycosyltransferase involved in cell wall biosynthesis